MAPVSHTRILFVGDMHLGKRPSTPELESSSITLQASDLGPRVAWEEIVNYALSHKIDAVALAGDLVDGDNDLFEGRALLEKEIEKLTAAGIEVCAVAGNHDTLIMPVLAKSIPDLKLLGHQGQWSECTISGGGPDIRLVGWSFPAKHHATSPFVTHPPESKTGVITLGLLHCDLGSLRSNYAPVSAGEFERTGYQAWFLGHIHQPGAVPDLGKLPASPFYLGSITGLDRNEKGIHGPVLVEVAQDGSITGKRIPLAPLHWDILKVSVDSLFQSTEAEPWDTILRNHLMTVLDNLPQWDDPDLDHIKALGLSISLIGQVQEPQRVAAATEKIQKDDQALAFSVKGKAVFVRKLSCEVTSLANLHELADREDPPGLLARQILILENPGGSFPWIRDGQAEAKRLIFLGRQELNRVARETSAEALFPLSADPDDDVIAKMMIRTGYTLLAGLLEQGRSNNATS